MASLTEAYNPIASPELAQRLNTEYNRQYSPVKAPTFPAGQQKPEPAASPISNIPANLQADTGQRPPVQKPSPQKQSLGVESMDAYDGNQWNSHPAQADWAGAAKFRPTDINQPSRGYDPIRPTRLQDERMEAAVRPVPEILSPELEALVQKRVKEELAKRDVSRIEKFTGMPPAVVQSLLLVATGVFIIVALDILLSIVLALKK
jgi:hypothetical protein